MHNSLNAQSSAANLAAIASSQASGHGRAILQTASASAPLPAVPANGAHDSAAPAPYVAKNAFAPVPALSVTAPAPAHNNSGQACSLLHPAQLSQLLPGPDATYLSFRPAHASHTMGRLNMHPDKGTSVQLHNLQRFQATANADHCKTSCPFKSRREFLRSEFLQYDACAQGCHVSAHALVGQLQHPNVFCTQQRFPHGCSKVTP